MYVNQADYSTKAKRRFILALWKVRILLPSKSLLNLNLQYNWNITEYISNPITNLLEWWFELILKLSKPVKVT